MERFRVNVYDDLYGTPVLFKENAFENSNSVLNTIYVYAGYSYLHNWDFGPSTLDNLNNLTSLQLNSYDFDSRPFPPSVLFSLQEIIFLGKGLYILTHHG